MIIQSLRGGTSPAENFSSTTKQSASYTVQRGDTLSSIAASHKVSLHALQNANPQVLNPDVLYPDEVLNMPVEASVESPTQASPQTKSTLSASNVFALASTSMPTLRQGSRGEAVRTLQQKLAQHGFNPGPADGVFGAKTASAVRAFQSSRGLTADGIVGPKTWAALNASAPPKSKGQAIVDAAAQIANQKYRYVWGGGHKGSPGASTGTDNPNTVAKDSITKGYDCSGFVRMAVYKATGKDLMNGTAAQQSSRCAAISKSELRPGDLIFWKTGGKVTHVAIYAGKNSAGVPMMYESAPSYEKHGSSYGTHLTPVSYQGTPSNYGRIRT